MRSTYPNEPGLFGYNYEFGIVVRGDGSSNGYEVGMANVSRQVAPTGNTSPQGALIALIQNDNTSGYVYGSGFSYSGAILKNSKYQLDTAWHTYRVEVTGNDIKFFVDDGLLAETTDNTYLSGMRVGLRAVYADVDVSSFKVTAL